MQSRLQDVFQEKKSAVVRVSGASYASAEEGEERKAIAVSATGFFISNEGHVLTTSVVVQKAERIFIEHNSFRFHAELLGMDKRTNLALLQVPEPPQDASFVSLSEMRSLPAVGTFVLPITRKAGLPPTPNLKMVQGHNAVYGGLLPTTFLRTDVVMVGGENGAPVFDLSGQLIGMLAVYLPAIEESFIIPSSAALRIVDDLKNFGEVRYGWIGIEIELRVNIAGGAQVFITKVKEGSPADEASLQVEDRLVSIGELPINSLEDLQNALFFARVGRQLPLIVEREADLLELSIKVMPKPEEAMSELLVLDTDNEGVLLEGGPLENELPEDSPVQEPVEDTSPQEGEIQVETAEVEATEVETTEVEAAEVEAAQVE